MLSTPSVRRAVAHVARSSSGSPLDRSLRVTLTFHPDRLVDDATVLQRLAHDGRYRSQFATGTSNGGLTAHHGPDSVLEPTDVATADRFGLFPLVERSGTRDDGSPCLRWRSTRRSAAGDEDP